MVSGEEVKKKWRNLRDTYIKYLKNVKRKNKTQQNFKRWQWAIQMSEFHQYIVNSSRANATSVLNDEDRTNEGKTTPEIFMELEDTELEEDPIADDEYNEGLECSSSQNATCFDDSEEKNSPFFKILQVNSISKPCSNVPRNVPLNVPPLNPLKRKLISSSKEDSAEPSSSVDTLVENYQKKELKLDSVDLLFLAYANTVKSFSGKRQAIAKLKVAEVITEQEILHHEETNSVEK